MSTNVRPTQILLKRGNTAVSSTYTGPVGEVTIDTDLKTLRIHDGVTPGGNIVVGVSGGTVDLTAVNTAISGLRANVTAANTAIVTANTALKSYTDGAITRAINNLISGAPGTLDTLNEIAANLASQGSAVGSITNSITSLRSNAATQQTQIDSLAAGASANIQSYLTHVAGNIIPASNVVYSLGDPTHQWKSLYVSGRTIYLGGIALSMGENGLTSDLGFDLANANASSLTTGNLTTAAVFSDNYFYSNGTPFVGSGTVSADTGNTGFRDNLIYNLNGPQLVNGDLSHGATAAILLPANGNSNDPIQVNNTYGNVVIQSGEDSDITATWTFNKNGSLKLADPFPISFTATLDGDHYHIPGGFRAFSPGPGVDASFWAPTVTFTRNGSQIETHLTPIPSAGNPGYVNNDYFNFTEDDHGIPGYTLSILLQNVYSANVSIACSPAPFLSQAPVLEFPDGTIQTTATFDANGVFRVPGTITKADALILNSTGAMSSNVAAVSVLGDISNVILRTITETDTNTWQFDQTGNLILPTSGSINYANGQSILSGISATVETFPTPVNMDGGGAIAVYENDNHNADGGSSSSRHNLYIDPRFDAMEDGFKLDGGNA